jgi:LemA protein
MKKVSTGWIILWSFLCVFLICLFLGIGSYNSLVKLKETVDSQSAGISVQLQRRVDLIPNIVSTVKGYTAHEAAILDDIAKSRTQLTGATGMKEKAEADSHLTESISRLLVIVENYPALKADKHFSELMDVLAGTENRISVARKDYNDAVKVYNQKTKTFPSVIFASVFGFAQAEYFEAAAGSDTAPAVNFN